MTKYAFNGHTLIVKGEDRTETLEISEFEDGEHFAEFAEDFSIGFEKAAPKGYTCQGDDSPRPWYAPWVYWDYDDFLPSDGVFRTAEELGEMHAKNYYDELEELLAEEQKEVEI